MEAIPSDTAIRLCNEIYEKNRRRLYTYSGLWCWGCGRFSRNISQRCFANAPGNRGCSQVNTKYDRELPSRPAV